METFLLYLVRVSVATTAFYLLYLLLFNKRKQFLFNRFYLMGSFLMSIFIPLMTITVTRQAIPQLVLLPGTTESAVPEVVSASGRPQLATVLLLLYGIGVSVFLIRLLTGHLRVLQIARKSHRETFNGIRVFVTTEDVHPFTFFRKIVVPRENTSQQYFPIILWHEKIHADGHHTMDILFSEILFLLQWFNPFAWLLKSAVKNNLEYLTDQEVTREADPHSYQLALVALVGKSGIAPFLNALNGNDLKNRIIMMKKKTENRNSVIRQLMVLPLMALLITSLSAREYKTLPSENPIVRLSGESFQGAALSTDQETQHADMTTLPADPMQEPGNSSAGAEFQKTVAPSPDTIRKSADVIEITGIRTGDGKKPLYILDGKEVANIDISPDNIENISVLKDASATALYGEKGKNGVIIITSKSGTSPVAGTKNYAEIKGIVSPSGNERSITSQAKLRGALAQSIRYPVKAQESSQQGIVRIYAYVNGEGEITQIMEKNPGKQVIAIDEIVIVAYKKEKTEKTVPGSKGEVDFLKQEGALQVKQLPTLGIPEYKNQWVMFRFNFVLQ